MARTSDALVLILTAWGPSAAALQVAVTGANGRTGGLCYKRLYELPGTEPVGIVRSKSPKVLKRMRQLVNADEESVARTLHEADVTQGPEKLAEVLREQKVEALLIATSAVPQIQLFSLVKLLVLKIFGRSERPTFKFRAGGTPEEVDWIGQKHQIDAAVQSGCVKHVVLCSSMGGTQPENFLNTIGQQADGSGGQILMWKRKAEQYLISSGIPYTILHPGGLLDKPGGRPLLLGVDDELLQRKTRNIPREDVAEVMVQSLFVPEMKERSIDIIALEGTRLPGGVWTALSTSATLGNCRYDIELPEPISQLS